MGIKVYLDDIRPTPPGWKRAYTAWEAIAFCQEGNVDELSLDYDLADHVQVSCGGYGENVHPGCGTDVSRWLLEQAHLGNWDWIPATIRIHSANPCGAKAMAMDIVAIERLKNE